MHNFTQLSLHFCVKIWLRHKKSHAGGKNRAKTITGGVFSFLFNIYEESNLRGAVWYDNVTVMPVNDW